MTKSEMQDRIWKLEQELEEMTEGYENEKSEHLQTAEEKDKEIEHLESEVYKQFEVRTNCGEAKYYCDNPVDKQLFDLFTEALVSIKPTDMYDNLQKILKYKIVL